MNAPKKALEGEWRKGGQIVLRGETVREAKSLSDHIAKSTTCETLQEDIGLVSKLGGRLGPHSKSHGWED